MSQSGALRGASSVLPSNVPTSFVTDDGTAIPTNYILNVVGNVSASGSDPISTSGSGDVLTINSQFSQAIAATDATKVGLASFDSTAFNVDANGFVTVIGSSSPFSRFVVDIGTSPVVPTGGTITFNGDSVAAGTSPVRTNGTGANTVALEVQISQASAATDSTKVGLSCFDSASFAVNADGFVSLAAAGPAMTITGNSGGALSTTANNWDIVGSGSITTSGAASTLTVQLQNLTDHNVLVGAGTTTITKVAPHATSGVPLISQGAAADPTFGTAVVAGGGTGAVTLTNHGVLIGQGTSAVVATTAGTAGQVLQSGGAAADPLFSTATYPATTTINQILYSSAANTVTGLATANKGVLTTGATGIPVITALATDGQLIIGSTAGVPAAATLTAGTGITITNGGNSISIAANGSVVGQTITGDSGGALSPTAGNWNLLGSGSIATSGAGSTLTTQLTGLTDHSVLVGAGTTTITKVAPSATSGVPLISQGAASDPVFGTAVVAGGGTGATSLTAYSVVCGGTTSTNPLQSVASVGTSGQVLTSNGAGALPTFQDAGGSGGGVPNLTYISTQTASASAQLDFTTGIDATYRGYRFIISNLVLSASAELRIRGSTDGLSTFITVGTTSARYTQSVTAPPVVIGTNTSNGPLCIMGTTALAANGYVDVFYPSDADIQTMMDFQVSGGSNSGTFSYFGFFSDVARQAVNAIRFIPSSGTLTSGTINLYGIS
jgi:hypothetical protein